MRLSKAYGAMRGCKFEIEALEEDCVKLTINSEVFTFIQREFDTFLEVIDDYRRQEAHKFLNDIQQVKPKGKL